MGTHPARGRTTHSKPRGFCAALAFAALSATLLPLLTGCPDDVQREFRDAAGESLQSGVSAILDGFVDGVFAVLEPEEEAAATEG